ncbi:uncharacterized protein LOC129596824 [Paramacrobiotus metropolitanus]|uniref:uncharacterized protein LOC129596824 n=1 Tax=Paramacrobiotus metropolitanus TaxID=2943436 RepID=UPI0024463042|nr:uncharacterized protein LOC129596824 [Paramacrobiotus metropolitanus]
MALRLRHIWWFFVAAGVADVVRGQSSGCASNYVGLGGYSSTGYGTNPSSSNGFCGIGNAVKGQTVDLDRLTGTWYSYATWTPDTNASDVDSVVSNTINFYRILGKGLFPTTTIPAAIMVQEQLFYNNASDTTCRSSREICYMTTDGRQIGVYFNPPNPARNRSESAGVDSSIVLATDYDTYAIFYLCYATNSSSGLCAYPDIYVNTRKKPTDITASDRQTISGAVNAAVKPYCLDVNAFQLSLWSTNKPDCPRVDPSPCYTTVAKGFNDTIEAFPDKQPEL